MQDYAEYIIWNVRLDEAQGGIKIARRNSNNFRYADDTILMAESEEKLKNLLMKVKEENEKPGLKLNTQKTKITASGPITSWQIDGEWKNMEKQWKQWQTLFSWAPKSLQMVTAAMKLRHLLLGRKAITNVDSVLKSRDITLPKKICPVKAMIFPAVMYRCESWTTEKAGCWRIDAFELWC